MTYEFQANESRHKVNAYAVPFVQWLSELVEEHRGKWWPDCRSPALDRVHTTVYDDFCDRSAIQALDPLIFLQGEVIQYFCLKHLTVSVVMSARE